MNEGSQGEAAEAENPAKALLGDKWFWPVLEELEIFQSATAQVIPGAQEVLADDTPHWALLSAMACGKELADITGFDELQNLNARKIGMIVGSQLSLCEAYERSYLVFSTLRPEAIRKIDGVWWPGFCNECAEFTRNFAERFTPAFRGIWRKVIILSQEAGTKEHVDYCLGFARGSEFVAKVLEKMRNPPKHKRGKDAQARNCVYYYAMCCGREIDAEKGNLSWPELHQGFLEFYDHKVEIDEFAFKKILFLEGLKGVGNAGRRPSNEIGTPKNLRGT